ncbi:MAG: hypothetical protein KDC75_16085, partial [Phaeodactylibacter sp.]|nr:hypothetical protein [Phaeodactylibacter sp.]
PIQVSLDRASLVVNPDTTEFDVNNYKDIGPFYCFFEKVENILKLPKDSLSFEEYSDYVLSALFNTENREDWLNDLRVFRIYLASGKGHILMFPFQYRDYPGLVSHERPWWWAAWKENGKGESKKHPSTFDSGDFGLSFLYTDIESKTEITLVRTFWHKFEVDGEKYVIGIDFFLNNEEKDSEAGAIAKMYNHPLVKSAIWSITAGVIFFILAVLFLKDRINNLIARVFPGSIPEGVWQMKASRQDLHFANAEEDSSERVFEIQGISKNEQFDFTGTAAGWAPGVIRKKKEGIAYSMSKKYKLSLSDELPNRGIEIWKVTNSPKHGSGKEQTIGFFEVKWKNAQALEEELKILPVFWESEEYNNQEQEIIMDQLKAHLLRSEDPQVNVSLDPIDNSYLEEIPEPLLKLPFIDKAIASSKNLLARKFEFSKIENYRAVYALGDVIAICSRAFLLNFLGEGASEGMLADFLSIEVKERYFIENQPREFMELYNRFSLVDQEAIKKDPSFKVILFDRNQMNIISAKRDFAIIKIDQSTQFVINYFPDNDIENRGWISWRTVDINYFNQLFKKRIQIIGGDIREARKVIEQFE